jgi:hypothetical protein
MLNGATPTITTAVSYWDGKAFVEIYNSTCEERVLIAELTIMPGMITEAHGCQIEFHGMYIGPDCWEDESYEDDGCKSPIREFVTSEIDIDFRTHGNVEVI